jgi:hypothetical protein
MQRGTGQERPKKFTRTIGANHKVQSAGISRTEVTDHRAQDSEDVFDSVAGEDAARDETGCDAEPLLLPRFIISTPPDCLSLPHFRVSYRKNQIGAGALVRAICGRIFLRD